MKLQYNEGITERFANINEAFDYWYELLNNYCEKGDSRDGDIRGEIINATTIIEDPTRCVLDSYFRKANMRYAMGELLWYLSGNRSLKEIQKITKNWDRFSDDGVSINSNYGYCIMEKFGFNQFYFVVRELVNNPNSRRAIIHIKEPSQKDSKDINCTMTLQYLIRDGKLVAITNMRSNDLWYGFPYDVLCFSSLQVMLSMILEVPLGVYIHNAGSLHLYERNAISKDEFERIKNNANTEVK